jgi:hypothetical protein
MKNEMRGPRDSEGADQGPDTTPAEEQGNDGDDSGDSANQCG